MTVGPQTTSGNVTADVASLAAEWADLASRTLRKWAYYNKLGLAGLQAAGFTAGDAQAVLDAINHVATPAQVYKGSATQTPAFNFEDSLVVWAGP